MFNGECKLATIWLYSRDTAKAGAFYRDVLEMKQIEHGDTNSFDGGRLRLSIHPARSSVEKVPNEECFLVFYVKEGIEEKYEKLRKRGVSFIGGIENEPYGRTIQFKDPDGHDIFLWEPPLRKSENFKNVKGLVDHYERILLKLDG